MKIVDTRTIDTFRLYVCEHASMLNGFTLKPGMYYGRDKFGLFVTNANRAKGRVACWRMRRDKQGKSVWKQVLEEFDTWLDARIDWIPQAHKDSSQSVKEEYNRQSKKRQVKRFERDTQRRLGLRQLSYSNTFASRPDCSEIQKRDYDSDYSDLDKIIENYKW